MDYTRLEAWGKANPVPPLKERSSLYEVCRQVVAGRAARGKRAELAGLFVVLVLAKLAGRQSLLGASDWVGDQECFLREGLQLSWKRMPCANPYSYALARLDSQPLNTALAACFERKEARSADADRNRAGEFRSPRERHVHLAIDGKALRGTGKQLYGGEEPQRQVLHVREGPAGHCVTPMSDRPRAH